MFILLTSPSAIINSSQNPNQLIINALILASKNGTPVAVISNKPKPVWFELSFAGSNVSFIEYKGRQKGIVIEKISNLKNTEKYNILVLAGNFIDIQMAKNGKCILLGAGWSSDSKVKNLGIKIDTPDQVNEVIDLMKGWHGDWWFKADEKKYSVRALMDLSTYGKSFSQVKFSTLLTATVKNGGNKLTALLIITSRSLLIDKVNNQELLLWGVYPSSSPSSYSDTEVLSDFTHRLRTTVSRSNFTKIDEPLFIRHTGSIKRSRSQNIDRTDPGNQITTLHLNPFYKERIKKRNIILIDDCTSHGLSFGVATAFLLKAGAASVTGIALGKLGNAIQYFDIDISSDPFTPVTSNNFKVIEKRHMLGENDQITQEALVNIM